MMKKIAIIPARSGSKRIPQKNVFDFMGKPLMAWTIEAALKSNLFDRIIVSTDSSEFADVAKSYGCDVPFLRDTNADDVTPVSMATIRAIEQAENHYGEKYDIAVQLMANAPIRDSTDVVNHFNHFMSQNCDFQISSFKFGWMNPWWAFKLNNNHTHEWIHPQATSSRSQDLPNLYCPTGAIWIAKTNSLFEAQTFYGPGFSFHEIDWKSAVDIDDYEDLDFAKAVYYLKSNQVESNV